MIKILLGYFSFIVKQVAKQFQVSTFEQYVYFVPNFLIKLSLDWQEKHSKSKVDVREIKRKAHSPMHYEIQLK